MATHAFIKRGETDEMFRIAGVLADDQDEYAQKAFASWAREAGKRAEAGLIRFLTAHKMTPPRATIAAASKLLSKKVRRELRG